MVKFRLLVTLIVVACIVYFVTHNSVVHSNKSLSLTSIVHVHKGGDESKSIVHEDKIRTNGEPEKGYLETLAVEKNENHKLLRNENKNEDLKPPVNVVVEDTNNARNADIQNVKKDKPSVQKTEKTQEKRKVAPKENMNVTNVVKEQSLCTKQGENLVGPLFIDQTPPKDMVEVEKLLSVAYGGTVEKGGWWEPSTCKARVKVAVVIPYRKRFEQLKIFLRHLHPILQRQQLYYRIIVVEMLEDDPFNRAGLFNIGFVEAMKMTDFDCFIFTDVDLLPEDDRNYYGCPTSPRHMSVGVDKFNYKLPYQTIFGGVGAFRKNDFEKINGMSNLFWGWGGEDDDLYVRITSSGLKLTRPSVQIGRYTMIKVDHFRSSDADPNRMNLLRTSRQRMSVDGLNTLQYDLKDIEELPLVTLIKIVMKRSHYVSR